MRPESVILIFGLMWDSKLDSCQWRWARRGAFKLEIAPLGDRRLLSYLIDGGSTWGRFIISSCSIMHTFAFFPLFREHRALFPSSCVCLVNVSQPKRSPGLYHTCFLPDVQSNPWMTVHTVLHGFVEATGPTCPCHSFLFLRVYWWRVRAIRGKFKGFGYYN